MRFFELYLTVWPCTTGRKGPAAGRGKTLVAFSARAASRKAGKMASARDQKVNGTGGIRVANDPDIIYWHAASLAPLFSVP
jgi:hypothetical protein